MNYFENVHNLDELRKAYRQLAKTHHPDRGGDVEAMKAINNQYEKLSKTLINGNVNFDQERKAAEHQYSADIQNKINEIILIDGIDIEVAGYWIWITGNTYPVKEKIKGAGFMFSKKKTAWHWHTGEFRKKSGKQFEMDDIRAMFGSEKVNSNFKQSNFIQS